MGYGEDKIAKLYTKVKGAYRDMKGEKSVGIVEGRKERHHQNCKTNGCYCRDRSLYKS